MTATVARKPPRAAMDPPGRLPRARTSFVGREADLAALRALVEEGAALVTLLGPPGIGKTRLAIEAARALGGDAIFCDVSAARDGAALSTLAALALGVSIEAPMSGDALTAQVGRALAQRGEVIFVIDNAEQVAAGAAIAVSRWMDAAPGATFLVTSRERLRVEGEHAVVLGPLAVPALAETSADRLLGAAAVALLVDRARAADAGFRAADPAALAAIARRVEGVPLALELCAPRLAMLEPARLLARLAERLDVLANDRRGVSARQATLRGAIDWSWDLLDDDERRALAQCSVFRGGFDLDAALAVIEVPSGRAVLDVLSALRDKSLVAVDDDGGDKRYRLYESIREHAAEELAPGDGAADRHARWFAEAGARWAMAAKGSAFEQGLTALGREHDNLLAARAHAEARGDVVIAAELTLCIEPLAIVRGPVLPYLDLITTTLAEAGGALPARVAARLHGSLGVAESRRGRPVEAVTCFERAVARAEAAGAEDLLPFLLAKLANQQCVLGADAAAEAAFARARDLLDRRDDPAVRGVLCRHHAFFLWRAGRVDEARREGERARALLEAHGDRRELAYVLCDLAASYLDAGAIDEASAALAAALDLLRRLQYRRVEGRSLLLSALARREAGLFAEAEADLDRARALAVEDTDDSAIGFALWHLACLALERDDAPTARLHAEGALARYEQIGDAHLVAHGRMVLGAALARLGDLDGAAAELLKADELLAGAATPLRDALALLSALVPLARDAAGRGEAERVLHDLDARAGRAAVASVRFARRVLARALAGASPMKRAREPAVPIEADLVIGDDGRWFRLSEQREVSLDRRAALRRILAALAHQRVTAPGTALPLDRVLASGWPGERVSFEAGTARVYNAIQRLRRLGLERVLRTRDDGYLLDAEIEVRIAVDRS